MLMFSLAKIYPDKASVYYVNAHVQYKIFLYLPHNGDIKHRDP